MNARIIAVVLSIAVACPSLAADTSQWTNVQALQPGARIGVIQSDKKRIEGRFESATESAVTLQSDRTVTIAKGNVTRVYRRGISRSTRALIGLGIGAGAGAALAVGIRNGSSNEGFFAGDALVAVTIIAAAAVGAGFGALAGSGRKTVYQRR